MIPTKQGHLYTTTHHYGRSVHFDGPAWPIVDGKAATPLGTQSVPDVAFYVVHEIPADRQNRLANEVFPHISPIHTKYLVNISWWM